MNEQDPKLTVLELRRELIQTQQVVLSYQLRDVVAELDKAKAAVPTEPAS